MAVREQDRMSMGALEYIAARPLLHLKAVAPDSEAGFVDIGAQNAPRFDESAIIIRRDPGVECAAYKRSLRGRVG